MFVTSCLKNSKSTQTETQRGALDCRGPTLDFRKGAHLICMQDRIDYGWEMALLLQRAKGEIEARRTALLPQDLRQLPQSPETGRTGLSFPGPDGLVDASQKMGCRYDTLFYCSLSFYP